MTSFAFIFGVVPLVLAEGAGAEMRRSLGTAVFGGMLGVTLFGIFLTPVFYYVIQWFGSEKPAEISKGSDRKPPRKAESPRGSGRPQPVMLAPEESAEYLDLPEKPRRGGRS